MKLHGILAPITTPFHAGTEDLDLAGFTRNVAALVSAGLHGIVVCGSTGEAALLSDDERRVLLEAARAATPRSSAAATSAAGTERAPSSDGTRCPSRSHKVTLS